MLQATYDAPRVFFYVVRSVIPQWWAGRGHRKVRRLPVTPVVPTPFKRRSDAAAGALRTAYRLSRAAAAHIERPHPAPPDQKPDR